MNRPRHAVVLAAGRGSRMGASTENQPKCLQPLAGRPILEWTLRALKSQGIDNVLIVGGWCAEKIAAWGSELRVNAQWRTTNMVRSLVLASDWLQAEPTLVAYGDGAYSSQAIAAALAPSEQDLLVPIDIRWHELWLRRFADPLDDAETLMLRGDRLIEIGQRPQSLAQVHGQYMGLVRTTPAGWRRVEAQLNDLGAAQPQVIDRLDMTGLLAALVRAGEPVHALPVDGGWVEIDSQSDVLVVERGLQEGGFSHDFRG